VYRASLYVPQKTQQAEAVIQSDKPRRLVLQMLRNVEGKSMHEAMLEGLQKNSSAAELAAFAPQLQALSALFQQSLNQGDKVVLDFLPGKGVLISIKNQAPVAIASDAFGSALLKIWLGKKPADTGLKKALLGS
jgi:long-chain acyl-CoA synthetase